MWRLVYLSCNYPVISGKIRAAAGLINPLPELRAAERQADLPHRSEHRETEITERQTARTQREREHREKQRETEREHRQGESRNI